eukprot:snap_masked-scaffold_53-processed-gene-1.60-mRNA-1 protein AED:1.00 eAED:1.00 QI:0/0/0/0/1/1/3/0/296
MKKNEGLTPAACMIYEFGSPRKVTFLNDCMIKQIFLFVKLRLHEENNFRRVHQLLNHPPKETKIKFEYMIKTFKPLEVVTEASLKEEGQRFDSDEMILLQKEETLYKLIMSLILNGLPKKRFRRRKIFYNAESKLMVIYLNALESEKELERLNLAFGFHDASERKQNVLQSHLKNILVLCTVDLDSPETLQRRDFFFKIYNFYIRSFSVLQDETFFCERDLTNEMIGSIGPLCAAINNISSADENFTVSLKQTNKSKEELSVRLASRYSEEMIVIGTGFIYKNNEIMEKPEHKMYE